MVWLSLSCTSHSTPRVGPCEGFQSMAMGVFPPLLFLMRRRPRTEDKTLSLLSRDFFITTLALRTGVVPCIPARPARTRCACPHTLRHRHAWLLDQNP